MSQLDGPEPRRPACRRRGNCWRCWTTTSAAGAARRRSPGHLVRFTQRETREQLGWGDFQLRRHLARLVELEYVLAHRTGYGNQRQYELLYEGQGRQGEPFLLGLADPEELSAGPQDE